MNLLEKEKMIGQDGKEYTFNDAREAENSGNYEEAFRIYRLGWQHHGLELAIKIKDFDKVREFYDEGLRLMSHGEIWEGYLRALKIAKNFNDGKKLKEIYDKGLNSLNGHIWHFNEAIKLAKFMEDKDKEGELYQKAEDEAKSRLNSCRNDLKKILEKVGIWTEIKSACETRSSTLDTLLEIEKCKKH